MVCGSGSDHVIRWVGECIWTGIGTSLASLALFSLRGPGLRYPGLEDTGVWIGARAGKLGRVVIFKTLSAEAQLGLLLLTLAS